MTADHAGLDEILKDMRSVAAEAGALLLDGLDRPKNVVHKGEVDLVTEYDRRSEELIADRLSRRYPGFAFLGEEGGPRGEATSMWIVDPLDGTTNYSHRHPVFAVSIGLRRGDAMVAGVIAMPALETTVWARAGGGAYCDGEPISVSKTAQLDKALLATGFPYDRRTASDDNTRELVAFMKRSQGVRRCGAAAADMAMVARGISDGFWEPRLHPWDLAAGQVIVEEAGGVVTDYEGGPLDLERGWVVAANPSLHPAMLEVISTTRVEIRRAAEDGPR